MKKTATLKRILTMLLTLSMLCGGCMTTFAAEDGEAASNLASLREKYDLTRTAGTQVPQVPGLRQRPSGRCCGKIP